MHSIFDALHMAAKGPAHRRIATGSHLINVEVGFWRMPGERNLRSESGGIA
jgi:hypothetical protein